MNKTPSSRKQQIDDLMASLFPHGPGAVDEATLRAAIEQAMEIAEAHMLESLLDTEQALVAVNQRLESAGRPAISRRRLQAIARVQHDRHGVGYNVTGTNAWLFRPSEIDGLVPGCSVS